MSERLSSTPQSQSAVEVVSRLKAKTAEHLGRIEESGIYKRMTAPDAPPKFVATVVKYVLLEVFSYGPHVTEATFTAIGRMPKGRPDLMRPLIRHDLEEVDHGEMALRDFVALGGDESWARSRKMSPASFAMAATVRMLGERESPFSYLGYMYPFEALTPTLTARARMVLARARFPGEAQKFVDFHATEDVAHERLLADVIGRVVDAFPNAVGEIEHGFDCFAAVYPIPIWEHAERVAQAELEQR